MEIQNKRIVLTGAASGIGRSLANLLSQYDCNLIMVDRNTENLSTSIDSLKGSVAEVFSFVGDIADPSQLDRLFEFAIETMAGIDLFIANAGYSYYEKLEQEGWEHIDQIFRVNVYSPIYTAIKMKNLNLEKPYKVVITASAIGKLGLPGYALYGATKSAIDRFAEAYRFELNNRSSLVLIYPIATRTNFFQEASSHEAPIPWPSQSPDQVAKAIIKGIEKDRQSIYPSNIYRVFLGIGKLIPVIYHLEQNIELQRFRQWLNNKSQ